MINMTNTEIEFLTKDRRKKKGDKTRDLLYGLKCNTCNNIILAAFITDKEVDLWNYEESSILKLRGTNDIGSFSHLFPTVESDKGDSCYESTVNESEGIVVQTLRMKNHVLPPDRVDRQVNDKYEVGERPCLYAASASLRKDMAVKTSLALAGIEPGFLDRWDWKNKTDETIKDLQENNQGFRMAESFGPIPVFGVLIPKDRILYNVYIYNRAKYYYAEKT
jgi:hypothetical protein